MGRVQRLLAGATAVLCAACAQDAPTAGSSTSGQSEVSQSTSDPSSPLAGAREVLRQGVVGVDQVTRLQRAREKLAAWLTDHPEHPDADVAMVLSSAVSLTEHGAVAALSGHPPQEIGDGGGTTEGLRSMIATLAELNSEEASQLREAALVLLGLDPQVRDVSLNRESAMALARETSPMGLVVRAVMLARLEASLRALRDLPPELATQIAMPLAGRVLCPRCADTHHMTPDKVTHLLLKGGNQGGVICPGAMAAGSGAVTPRDEIAALSACDALRPQGEEVEATLLWATNIVVLGALRTIDELGGRPVGDGPLASVVTAQNARLKALCAEPLVLPVPVVSSLAGASGDETMDWVIAIPELGSGGLSREEHAPGILVIGPEDLRVGLRPTVTMREGAITSMGVATGLPAGGRVIAPASALVPVGGSTDIRHVLSSALTEVRRARRGEEDEDAVTQELEMLPVDVVVDARTPANIATTVLTTLKALGTDSIAFVKTATHGHLLHLLVRDATPSSLEILDVGYERPLLAVISADHVDLWRPMGAIGEPREGKKVKAFPSSLLPGYRGKTVERLRLVMPEGADGLDRGSLGQLRAGMDHLLGATGAGPLLHVIAADGARAADVLRVARIFQERPGKALGDPGAIWPGTTCGSPAYRKFKRTPSGCPTGVAVAFSAVPPPSTRGLSPAPPGASTRGTTPKAQAGFCDKKDIRLNMKKRAGSFKFCYERELKLARDLEGRVVFRFTIGRDGKVKGEPQVASSTLGSKAVHQCLSKNIKKVTFPKPDGGICEVKWPFMFQSK